MAPRYECESDLSRMCPLQTPVTPLRYNAGVIMDNLMDRHKNYYK